MKTFMYLAGNTRIKKENSIKYCYVITKKLEYEYYIVSLSKMVFRYVVNICTLNWILGRSR